MNTNYKQQVNDNVLIQYMKLVELTSPQLQH